MTSGGSNHAPSSFPTAPLPSIPLATKTSKRTGPIRDACVLLQLPTAVRAVRAVPGGRFVLDHLGKPVVTAAGPCPDGAPGRWATGIRDLAAAGDTAVKLSGMVTEVPAGRDPSILLTPYADLVLDAFGADRVMVGSDWPVCLLTADYHEVLALADTLVAHLSAAEAAQVTGTTATRVYALSAPAPHLPMARTAWLTPPVGHHRGR